MLPVDRCLAAAGSVAALVALFSAGTAGFADSGHRIVGRLAELHLRGSRALQDVRKILRPGETLADASLWPDTIKDPLYEDADTPMFRLDHPEHDVYHYANLPFQADRYAATALGARPTDIVQTIRTGILVLRGSSTAFTPREALRLIAHLVGDLHQPLHTGNGFVSASGPLRFVAPDGPGGWRSTLGGNALVYGPQDRFNLHSYWDAHIVNLALRNADVERYASRLLTDVPATAGWDGLGDAGAWAGQWAAESLVVARQAYSGIELLEYIGPDEARRTAHRWRIRQPPDYDTRNRSIIRTQLARGGYRLAAVLRAIWP